MNTILIRNQIKLDINNKIIQFLTVLDIDILQHMLILKKIKEV